MIEKLKREKAIASLTLLVFLLYLFTLSISLDDEDSVHFALGLTDFNVTKFQPHPPGFPVYMALGMLFNSILRNGLLSLTLLSAAFGALSVLAFYLLSREMFGKEIALAASLLASITPLFWMSSVKAMSDMTCAFFVLASMLFIYRYDKYAVRRDFYAGSLLAGIAAGVRIHSIFILFPLLAYGAYVHRKDFHANVRVAGLLAIAISSWFIPLVAVTGVQEYFTAAGSQLMFRVDRPDISLLGSDLTSNDLSKRVIGFPYFFLLEGYGINLAGLGVLSVMLLFFMVACIVIFIKKIKNKSKDKRFVFFLVGFAPYLITIFIMLPPFNPRYIIMLVPLLSLVFTKAIWSIGKKKIRYALFCFLLFLILIHSVFLALEIRKIPSPPVQLIDYVNANYGQDDYIVLGGFAEKYFTYYTTHLTILPSGTSCEAIKKLIAENKTVLAMTGSDICGFKTGIIASFKRDPRVHIKRSVMNLYELF
jgi:4-amino-4-deoxy-L-arabinose transferase-like glycosyltransferase